MGALYTINELKALRKVCDTYQLIFHMDGCRLYNAAVALDCDLKDITWKVNVDILSLGGTKNGCLCAEAVILFNQDFKEPLSFLQKQSLNLASKMRFGKLVSSLLLLVS
eukprot:Awhi_evm1s6001